MRATSRLLKQHQFRSTNRKGGSESTDNPERSASFPCCVTPIHRTPPFGLCLCERVIVWKSAAICTGLPTSSYFLYPFLSNKSLFSLLFPLYIFTGKAGLGGLEQSMLIINKVRQWHCSGNLQLPRIGSNCKTEFYICWMFLLKYIFHISSELQQTENQKTFKMEVWGSIAIRSIITAIIVLYYHNSKSRKYAILIGDC